MSINEKNVGEIARQLGLSSGKGVSKAQIDYLSSKSDAELENIENITSNNVKLEFSCKEIVDNGYKKGIVGENQINIYLVYRGGRYIIMEVEKLEIEE